MPPSWMKNGRFCLADCEKIRKMRQSCVNNDNGKRNSGNYFAMAIFLLSLARRNRPEKLDYGVQGS